MCEIVLVLSPWNNLDEQLRIAVDAGARHRIVDITLDFYLLLLALLVLAIQNMIQSRPVIQSVRRLRSWTYDCGREAHR